MSVTRSDIEAAAARIKKAVHETPALRSETFSNLLKCDLFFKCENLQKIGAFKARGACNAVFQLSQDELDSGVITHSAGNHGQAIAYAARMRGARAYVVMPKTAPAVKIEAVRGYGAKVILCEPTEASRNEVRLQVQAETKAVFVHPFQDERVIAGQGTIALELERQIPKLTTVICQLGGGGLISGIATALKEKNPKIRIVGVEPEGAADAVLSRKEGKRTPVPGGGKSVCDGLLTTIAENTFEIIQKYVDEIVTVPDEETIAAMRQIWERTKLIVEPSGAITLAALLNSKTRCENERVAVILSGGNVDLGKLFWAA